MDNNGQCLWCDNFVPRISGGLAASSRPGVVNAQHPDPQLRGKPRGAARQNL